MSIDVGIALRPSIEDKLAAIGRPVHRASTHPIEVQILMKVNGHSDRRVHPHF
jgi:hypothetical protein